MTNPQTLRIGPLLFTSGVSGINLVTMIFAAFGTMAIVSFMSFMQPYVLNELLHIPVEKQGALTGNLHAFQEIIFIAVAGFIGALSDKLTRPFVYAAGFIVAAAGYALYPLADSLSHLYMIRALFAVGAAAVAIMLSACIVDYIQEQSRGRWLGVTSVANGLGILAMSFLLSRLPEYFNDNGANTLEAGQFSFWTVAALCLIVGLILYMGLYRRRGGSSANHLIKQLVTGAKIGLSNPRLAIAYGGAFIGRGDFAVIGTYFSLWVTQEGLDNGMSVAEALAIAGPLFGGIQLCAMLWAPVMGFITDRINRLAAVILGLAIAGSGYVYMSMISDPFSSAIYPAGILLGMGETSVIVSVGALLGQEARGKYSGSIVGVFGQLGGVGILVTTLLGGQLFDEIGRTAPFLMMGLMNFALMLGAVLVYQSKAGQPPSTNQQEPEMEK